MSVERSDKDKDADENADADQISTGRLKKSGQSIGLFTEREEIDIDFRVSGLPQVFGSRATFCCYLLLCRNLAVNMDVDRASHVVPPGSSAQRRRLRRL